MATKNRPREFRKSKSSFSCLPFPACFGRNRCAAKKRRPPPNADRKKLPWWARLRAGKSGRKTVPIDASVVVDSPRGPDEEGIVAVDVEVDGKRLLPAAGDDDSDQGGVDKILEGPDPDNPSKPVTCQTTLSPARKTDCSKRSSSSSSQLGSPDPEPGRRRVLTSCSTFPPPGSRKKSQPVGFSRMAGRQPTHSPGAETTGFRRSDAVVGMTVLMVSLAFLMLWGRICAIACTSAWFYFVRRLRTAMDTGGETGDKDGGGEVDFDSSEHKKKVIMAGLLQRNRR